MIEVRYFAVLRDRRGLADEKVDAAGLTARALVDRLVERHGLGLPSPLIRVAVNGAFVDDGRVLADGDQVVLIPPVAGG